jgi:ribose/xylose/arabinose/galactoside ABC-type transport system permease subunit|tara:strand:+ start:149 stop:298 length:150 start_codon:yes stop_codon:yes gene_type:complete
MFNKKGARGVYIPAMDFTRGLIVGLIIGLIMGAVIVYLGAKDIISIPFL